MGDNANENRPQAAQRFRMPETWESGRPQFDGKTYKQLDKFLEEVARVIAQGGINGEQSMKEKYISYLDDKNIREGWQMLAEFAITHTCAQWIKAVKELYPELEEYEKGSLIRLREICEEAQGCTRADLGKIKRFKIFFEAEAAKLLKPPAQVTNVNLVGTILKTFDQQFAKQIEDAMNLPGVAQIIRPDGVPVPAAAGVGEAIKRRGDHMSYLEVLKVAVYLADNWTGREALFEISGGRLDEKSLVEPAAPNKGSSGLPFAMKREFTDQMEGFALEIAAIKDTFVVRDKQMQDTIKKIEAVAEQARVLNQGLAKAPPNNGQSNDYRQQQGNHFNRDPNPYRMTPPPNFAIEDINCHWCGEKGHMMKDCQKKNEKIDRGQVVIENGQVRLPGNLFIPRYPEHLSRDQKVEEWHRKRDSANPATANLYQHSFMNEAANPDQLDLFYDTTQDELRSARAQQAIMMKQMQQMSQMGRAGGYSVGSNMSSHGQGRETPPHFITEQDNSTQNNGQLYGQQQGMVPQFVQTTQAPQNTGLVDMGQLLNLLNVVQSPQNKGNGGVLDQLVATREQLKKSGQSPNPNF